MDDYDVFISHATEEDTVATRIAKALRAAGIRPWVDHEHGIDPGDVFPDELHNAVRDCAYGLFLMSEKSVKRPYCTAEWSRILALGKRLYVAKIDGIKVEDIPLRLGIIQYADLSADFDAGLAALIDAMLGKRELDPDAPTTGSAKRIGGSFPRYHLDLPLIGRDAELAAVKKSLADGNRITLITGLGGVGKTRLAVEVAARADFAGGAIWHEIADYSTLATLTNLIREHLDLPPAEDDAIWEALNRRAVLLVLDNAEVCKEPLAYARRLNSLDTAGGSRVLVTSRALWPDLRHAKVHSLAAPSAEAAADILRAMAEAEPPAHPPDGHVEELAEAARYHPRLMQRAVHWLDRYPVEYVLHVLRTLKGKDAEEALEDLIWRTVRLVEEEEGGPAALAALRRLAVCRGGFTFEAARAIMGEDTDPQALATLRRWGLVQLEGGRYEIDPLVIAAVGEDESAHRAHYGYYKALANEHDKRQNYLGFAPESANLEAAFERALAAGRAEDAYWLFNEATFFLANRGRFNQRMDWIERVAALEDQSDERLHANVQIDRGIVFQNHPTGSRAENLRRGIEAYEQALGFYKPEVDQNHYAMTQNNLGTAYDDLSEVEDRAENLKRAVAAYQEALRFKDPEAVPLSYATTQMNLGNAYRDLAGVEDRAGNLGRAVAAYREALRFYTPEAAPLGYATTQNNLGAAYYHLAGVEDLTENLGWAVAAYQEALRFLTPEAAPLDYAMTQNNLGVAYQKLSEVEDRAGNLGRAVAAYQEALRFWTPEAAPLDYAMTTANLGHAYRDLGDLSTAIVCWREAEKYFRLMGAVDDADKMQRWIDDAEGRLGGE